MSKADAEKFYAKLQQTAELGKKAKATTNTEGLVALGRSLGLEFTADDLIAAGTVEISEQVLTDEELDNVVGGKWVTWTSPTYGRPGCSMAPHTKMSSCNLSIAPGCERPPETGSPPDTEPSDPEPDKDGKFKL